MALVPCRQCRQPFYASCHDASCIDALCPYCEYSEPVVDDHLLMENGRIGENVPNDLSAAHTTARDTVRAQRPGPPTRGGRE